MKFAEIILLSALGRAGLVIAAFRWISQAFCQQLALAGICTGRRVLAVAFYNATVQAASGRVFEVPEGRVH
jgi:hypothetical protein